MPTFACLAISRSVTPENIVLFSVSRDVQILYPFTHSLFAVAKSTCSPLIYSSMQQCLEIYANLNPAGMALGPLTAGHLYLFKT
jgi:hypothetical protein